MSRMFSLSLRDFFIFPFSQAASVATLPSALLVETLSLIGRIVVRVERDEA